MSLIIGNGGGVRMSGGGGSVGSSLAAPVPVLGAELLANGDMETGDPPSNWTANGSATLSSVADERTGGSGAAAMNIARGAASSVAAIQTPTIAANAWVFATAWIKNVNAVNVSLQLALGTNSDSALVTATSWTQVFVVHRQSSSNQVRCVVGGANGTQGRFDDYSAKPLTLSSLFSTKSYPLTHTVTTANVTVTTGTRAGVVANLDNPTSPANFVFASHDGTTARLTKCVGGTYTDLVSDAATYVAGATIEIRRLASTNTYQLWYNGSQIGTNQTISDAGIVSNILYGYFNTYAGNSLSGFSCVAS